MRTSWPEARRIARDAAQPLETVLAAPVDAAGAALAAPLYSIEAQPVCDVSAMDGYAVSGAGPWLVTGTVFAGTAVGHQLRPGEAVAIATGAAVPAGAGAVIPVEQTEREGAYIDGSPQAKQHIRRRGEDFGAGRLLLPAGARVTAAVSGLAAATGQDMVEVHRKARVRVVVTGDEVTTSGMPGAGRVRDAIGPMLPPLIAAHGGMHAGTDYLPDRPDSLEHALSSGGEDVVAVCGSTSVGAADHLRTALLSNDCDILVDGVACRPGHPQLLGTTTDKRFVVGLPGNPFAALAAALTVLCPLIGALGGHWLGEPITAVLGKTCDAHPRDTRLVACNHSGASVFPVGSGGPASLAGPAMADVLTVIPPGSQDREVEILQLL